MNTLNNLPSCEVQNKIDRKTGLLWKLIVAAIVLMIAAIVIWFTVADEDTVMFEGHKYSILGYPADIFYYSYNGSGEGYYSDEEELYYISDGQWDMVLSDGDLYCISKSFNQANKYYSDDSNYDWYVVIDSEEDESALPITVSLEEKNYIYNMEKLDKNQAAFFDEFSKTGSIMKFSRDGVVRGVLSIVKLDGAWYWNTETIDESREKDDTWPEYIQPLPDSLTEKISEVE